MKIIWLGKSGIKIELEEKTISFDLDSVTDDIDYVFSSLDGYENDAYNLFTESCDYSDQYIEAYQIFEDSINHVAYKVVAEGIKIAHFGHELFKMSDDFIHRLGEVDVALIPVGKEGMDEHGVRDIMDIISANLVIPMNFLKEDSQDKTLKNISSFLKSIKGKYDYSLIGKNIFETSRAELKKRTRVIVMDDK